MAAKTIMIQGTASHVGKTTVATALCRVFKQDGHRVAPFKAQNMSNNSFVCPDGNEIARSQALQAEACGINPAVWMNPVLLKPSGEKGFQVVMNGKAVGHMDSGKYLECHTEVIKAVKSSFDNLREQYDIIVIEGSGSPAEINLKGHDFANMGIAKHANSPVIIVGDIDKGGVFAHITGTIQLLTEEEKYLVKGFIINKFSGDINILNPGLLELEKITEKKVIGVLKYYRDILLPEEDTMDTKPYPEPNHEAKLLIHVIKLPYISNFTDFEPLQHHPDVRLKYITDPEYELPDLIIIPGSKSTISDLGFLMDKGLDKYIRTCLNAGRKVMGICGGLQMLGSRILDPLHVESNNSEIQGLNIIDGITRFEKEKAAAQVNGIHIESRRPVNGYEIHMGKTGFNPKTTPLFRITERSGIPTDEYEGVVEMDGRVMGTFIHGLFGNSGFMTAFLNQLTNGVKIKPREPTDTDYINILAGKARKELDMKYIYEVIGV